MSTTHCIGPAFNYNGRIIQRCCVCGEKILDTINTERMLNPDGTPPIVAVWPLGRYIKQNEKSWTLIPECEKPLFDDFCIDLVE